jgi:hypothetical protein
MFQPTLTALDFSRTGILFFRWTGSVSFVIRDILKVLPGIKDRGLESEDKIMQLVGKLLLIPSAYNS